MKKHARYCFTRQMTAKRHMIYYFPYMTQFNLPLLPRQKHLETNPNCQCQQCHSEKKGDKSEKANGGQKIQILEGSSELRRPQKEQAPISGYQWEGETDGSKALLQQQSKDRVEYLQMLDLRNPMLKWEIVEPLHQLRLSDSGRWLPCEPFTSHNVESYTTIVSIMLEVRNTLCHGVSHGFEMDRLELHGSTKYLGKKYLDRFLTVNPSLEHKYFILVAITCIRTAVKVYACVDVVQLIISDCLIQSAHQYQVQDFLNCEAALCWALQFRFKISTPYDYVVALELLKEDEDLLPLLDTLILFLMTIPELFSCQAEQLFFGALLYIQNNRHPSPLHVSIIKATTHKWDQVQRIAELITQRLDQIQT